MAIDYCEAVQEIYMHQISLLQSFICKEWGVSQSVKISSFEERFSENKQTDCHSVIQWSRKGC